MMPAHNNFMIAKFTAQMRPRAHGSQWVTEEHNSFIDASINKNLVKGTTKLILMKKVLFNGWLEHFREPVIQTFE